METQQKYGNEMEKEIEETIKFNLIVNQVYDELQNAKRKYPDDQFPWSAPDSEFTIFEKCSLTACEAGEVLFEAIRLSRMVEEICSKALGSVQESNKYIFNGTGIYNNIRQELIQTASTAIRVLMTMKEES